MKQNKFNRKCAWISDFCNKNGHEPSMSSSNVREKKRALWLAKKRIMFDLDTIKDQYECACKIHAISIPKHPIAPHAVANHAEPVSGVVTLTTGQKAAATRRDNLAKMTPGERSAATRKKRQAGRKGAATRKANEAKNAM
jgi:hypothetical protein